MLLYIISFLLFLKVVVYSLARYFAWMVEVDPRTLGYFGSFDSKRGFWGENPGYDARGIYQILTHGPIYLGLIVYIILRFPFEFIRLHLLVDLTKKISDETIFEMCTKTALVLFGSFEGNEFVFDMPIRSPTFVEIGNCNLRTLKIRFAEDNTIISASSKNGEVQGHDFVGRNEILIAALRCILAHWVHPTIHVASEKCALEIQEKRILELEPSSHFVSSLHEGLLHAPLIGPLTPGSPFTVETGKPKALVEDCHKFSFPLHKLQQQKDRFTYYRFALLGRKIVMELVRKHKLNVNAENLFLNLILHGADHDGCYEVLSPLPLFSIDGSGTLFSCWMSYCFTHLWLKHVDNPLNSDLLTSNLNNPFYKDLYDRLREVDEVMADGVVVSCCF